MEIRGNLTCHECGVQGAAPCAYVGRDSVRCQTTWCAEHLSPGTDGRGYCRGHIRLRKALQPGTPPPLWDNRGPALVVWIIEDVARALHERLAAVSTPLQPIVLAETETDSHGNGWEAGWEIDHNGGRSSVTIFVADDNPSLVNLRIGDQVILLGEPPWIHYRFDQIVAAVDESLRNKFREQVISTVTFALQVATATTYTSVG